MKNTADLMTQLDRLMELTELQARQEAASRLKSDLGRLLLELSAVKERNLKTLEGQCRKKQRKKMQDRRQ